MVPGGRWTKKECGSALAFADDLPSWGIDKRDIGAIRILDTTTEFEISERVAGSFAAKIRRPDKEDSIRIDPLADTPATQAPLQTRSRSPWRGADDTDHGAHRGDNSRHATGSKHRGKPRSESEAKFGSEPALGKKGKHRNKSGRAGQPQANPSPAKAALGKKARKTRRG